MRERGLQITLMCLGVAVAAYAGCSSDSTSASTTGESTTTTTTGSASTTTGSASTTTGSASTTTGSTTTTGSATTGSGSASTGTSDENLAIQCGADADCGPNLKCIAADANNAIFGGGPANGYCTADCTTDADCPGNASFCIGAAAGKPGICLLTCDVGPQLSSLDEALDPEKCHGRDDLRCGPVNSSGTVTACVPTCGRDDQCPTGKVCDQRASVCVTTATTGLGLGEKCDPKAATPQCAGTCFNFSSGETMCSSPCVLGGEIDINDLTLVTDCGGLDKGICAYSPTGNGAGDFGICAEACKLHSDCQNPSFWCNDVGLPENGYCFGTTPCPKGQSDCTAPDKCLDTKYGPFCLDATVPLGDAAPITTTSSVSASSSSGSGSSSTSSSTSGAGGSASTSSATGAGGSSSASTGP